MGSPTAIDIGDDVILAGWFEDASTGSPIFPASLVCRVMNGHGSEVATYVAGQGTLTLNSPTYTVTQPIDSPGQWIYRFEGTTPRVADEFTFHVRTSAFQ